MSKTIVLTDEQYEALQKGESITIEPPKKSSWEPVDGEYEIYSSGEIASKYIDSGHIKRKTFGTVRTTEELAEKAAKEMRSFNRLLAYRDEFCPDYKPDWTDMRKPKYYVSFNHINKKWMCYSNNASETFAPCFPETIVKELVEKLNSGEVVL